MLLLIQGAGIGAAASTVNRQRTWHRRPWFRNSFTTIAALLMRALHG